MLHIVYIKYICIIYMYVNIFRFPCFTVCIFSCYHNEYHNLAVKQHKIWSHSSIPQKCVGIAWLSWFLCIEGGFNSLAKITVSVLLEIWREIHFHVLSCWQPNSIPYDCRTEASFSCWMLDGSFSACRVLPYSLTLGPFVFKANT